ncbi:MAG: hypothetical protein OSB03_17405 [Vicinamibacterales bacterium]|nr:hypothetical protein [Vicinamibacterales bacterium]
MIRNDFQKGPEGWCSYDYHASIATGGRNVFILTTWDAHGGIDSSACVFTDHVCWSADTPETPLSILPLLFYRSWVDADPVDLRQAQVSVYLRGDQLQLDGASCFFWVHAKNTRWHLTSSPLRLGAEEWASEPNRMALYVDESLWHKSWSADPERPTPLAEVLADTVSYGFSFVRFSREVTGRLSMAEFEILQGT